MTVADLIMVLQQHNPSDHIKIVIQETNAMRHADIDRVTKNGPTVYLVGDLLFLEALPGGA